MITEKKHSYYIGMHGELTQLQKDKQKRIKDLFDRIYEVLVYFSDILNRPCALETYIEEEAEKNKIKLVDLNQEFEEKHAKDSIWEDDDTRRFYEELPDYSNIFPVVQQKDIENMRKVIKDSVYNYSKNHKKGDDGDIYEDDDFDLVEYNSQKKATNPMMDVFFTKLQNCVNRDLIDNCVDEFLRFLNTKAHRRMIIDHMYGVPRNRCDLLPFYARFMATTYKYTPDIGIELGMLLRRELFYHIRKQRLFNLESKIKTVRFMAELVKFKIYTKADAITFLRALMQNAHNHIIDMLCYFLESCGRFLYLSPESHPLMVELLDGATHKISQLTSEHHRVMLQNAVIMCNPPPNKPKTVKQYTEFQAFVRYVIYTYFSRHTIKEVAASLLNLPWDNSPDTFFVVKALTSPWRIQFIDIPALASLIFVLNRKFSNISVLVVDNITEEIRLGLECNNPHHNQRRLCVIKYFGELYNFQIIEAPMIFKMCCFILTFGRTGNDYNENDPPDSFIKILLICELLKSVAKFLTHELPPKFNDFIMLFQAYILHKKQACSDAKPFPSCVNLSIVDMFDLYLIKCLLNDDQEEIVKKVKDITIQNAKPAKQHGFEEKKRQRRRHKIKVVSAREIIEESDSKKSICSVSEQNDETVLFERTFQKTIFESYQQIDPKRSDSHVDLVLPPNLNNIYTDTQERFQKQIEDEKCSHLKMLLLTKKNNKKCFKNVSVPKEDNLAVNVINKYHTIKDEKEQIKRFILNMNASK